MKIDVVDFVSNAFSIEVLSLKFLFLIKNQSTYHLKKKTKKECTYYLNNN